MPIVATVSAVLKLNKGDTIPCLKCKISKVWPVKTGQKKDSDEEWKMQPITVIDLADAKKKIDLNVWDKDKEIPAKLEGKTGWIYPETGPQAKITLDEFKDKKKVKVPKSATISLRDPSAEGEPEAETELAQEQEQEQAPESVDESNEAPEPKAAPKATSDMGAVVRVRKHYLKRSNCYHLAGNAALYMIQHFCIEHGIKWTKQIEQDFAMKIADKMSENAPITFLLSLRMDSRDTNLADATPTIPIDDLLEQIEQARKSKE